MKRGRKGFGEEIRIIERYSTLTEPFFAFLKDKLENGNDKEKWDAAKILKGAFEKMIPQDINDNHAGSININISKEVADRYETTPGTSTDSTGLPQVQGG